MNELESGSEPVISLPPAPPLGSLPWPPKRGLRLLYQSSRDHAPREVSVRSHQEFAMGSGPLRIVTLRPELGEGRHGPDFDAPWDRCSAAGEAVTLTGASGAILSPDRVHRYALWRSWDPELPKVAFVGLNPSTADEEADDATIRRCTRYARDWGFGELVMLNLFSFRARDPADLFAHPESDRSGPDNDAHLCFAAGYCRRVIVAWGAPLIARPRALVVADMLTAHGARLECLMRNIDGSPKHPLYCKDAQIPSPWSP